jgi:hypothetical protein
MKTSSNALIVNATPVPRRRGRWVLPLLMLAALWLLLSPHGHWHSLFSGAPVSVVIDGQEVFSGDGFQWSLWSPLEWLVGGAALLLTAVLLAVIVPTVVLLLVGVVALVVVCAVGLPVLLGVGAVLLALSPLLLILLLAWWLIKALLG